MAAPWTGAKHIPSQTRSNIEPLLQLNCWNWQGDGEVDRKGEPREESKAQVLEIQMTQVKANKAD